VAGIGQRESVAVSPVLLHTSESCSDGTFCVVVFKHVYLSIFCFDFGKLYGAGCARVVSGSDLSKIQSVWVVK